MIINNFELIKKLLTFESENDFYFLQILQRKKDHPEGTIVGSNNSSRLIKSYNIFSIEQLEKYQKEIILTCDLFQARAGINLNKRNSRTLALKMIPDIVRYIECNHTNAMQGLWNEVCGQYNQATDKRWIIDIDGQKTYEEIFQIEDTINSTSPESKNTICHIPSRNGLHLITRPFDLREFRIRYSDIDIQKNNPTNLYIPEF